MNRNNNSLKDVLAIECGTWKKTFFLDKSSYTIGRNSTSTFFCHHRIISRNHAYMIKHSYYNSTTKEEENIFWVVDGSLTGEKSTNGIYVNGKKCSYAKLKPGDIIFFGGIDVKAKYDIVNLETKIFLSQSTPLSGVTLTQSEEIFDQINAIESKILNPEDIDKLQLTSQGFILLDLETNNILTANEIYCDLVKYSPTEIVKVNLFDLEVVEAGILQDDLTMFRNYYSVGYRESIHRIKGGGFITFNIKSTLVIYEEKKCLLMAVEDISQMRKFEDVLRYQNNHDFITNLPNLELLNKQLSWCLGFSVLDESGIALVKLRLNQWQSIITSLSLEGQNRLSNHLTIILKQCLTAKDTLTKYSESEYIILREELTSVEQINNLINKISISLQKPFIVEDNPISFTANFGIAFYPQHGKTVDELLRKTHSALDYTYKNSLHYYQYYQEGIAEKLANDYNLCKLLTYQIHSDTLHIIYEPILNIHGKIISGLGSTIALKSSELGDVSITEILLNGKKMGYGNQLIRYWVGRIIKDVEEWQKKNIFIGKVTLKVLLSNLINTSLVSLMDDMLKKANNSTELHLEVIIDESICEPKIKEIIVNNLINSSLKLTAFNFDFVNLTYLREKNILNTVKVSPEMFSSAENSNSNSKNMLINNIINLSKLLHFNVIAEGVSDEEEKSLLSDLGCEEMQGLVISPPLSADEMLNFYG